MLLFKTYISFFFYVLSHRFMIFYNGDAYVHGENYVLLSIVILFMFVTMKWFAVNFIEVLIWLRGVENE